MGQAKQTIIKAICKSLGAVDSQQPSFTIVNEYRTYDENLISMIFTDKKAGWVFDSELRSIFLQDSYCFMEWPEVLKLLLRTSRSESLSEIEVRVLEFPCKSNFLLVQFLYFDKIYRTVNER